MNSVLKNPGMDWYSPYGCEYRSTTVCRAVLSTSEYQPVPPAQSPRNCRDALVLTVVRGDFSLVLGDWYSTWYSEGCRSAPLSIPLNRSADHQPGSPGEGWKPDVAQMCCRITALYERRAWEALGWSWLAQRSAPRFALLVVPFAAAGRVQLVRGASSIPAFAQVSGSTLTFCHKSAHKSAEIRPKSARRSLCTAAVHPGGGHCA